MKIRLFALILVACMIIGFSACDNPAADSGENSFDSNPVGDNEESTGDQNGSEDIIVPEEGSRDPETNVTDDDTDNDNKNDKVSVIGYLNELISGYFVSPYSYIPDTMRHDSESRLVNANNIPSDYSGFVNVSSIPTSGVGEQWNMISENIAQSQIFYTVLGTIDSVVTTSVVVFNNYIDENPEATAYYSFLEGIYTVTIKCDFDTVYYILDYETELPVLGEQAVQIALSMDLDTKTKTVRVQIGDANALTYTVQDNYYFFALKYLGIRRAAFEISRNQDGSVKGSIYEFLTAESEGISVEVGSAAEFYITDKYVTAIGNKADDMIGFDGYICELYDTKSGEMIAYEVKEKLSAVEYNTIWFNLRDVDGIKSVKYLPKTSDNEAMLFVNGSFDAFEVKKVGLIGGLKAASRRFDIEFRKQYYYYYDSAEESYKTVCVETPMLFVQEEYYDSLAKDVEDSNGIEIAVTVSNNDLAKLLGDYDDLVPIFIENKDRISPSDIVEAIGDRVEFD